MKLTFTGNGKPFSANNQAEQWLDDNGYSFGYMQGSDPRGIVIGNATIQKWRNLSREDKARLDGQMTGNGRNGPVYVEIF